MILANINVGAAANNGLGDPLRNAFETINQNFANILANSTQVAGVVSVAGKTGTVILGASDVAGVASVAYVNSAFNTLNATLSTVSAQPYTMSQPQNWQPIGPVYTVGQALDQLAFRLKQAGY